MDDLRAIDLITIAAILIGPVAAVVVDRLQTNWHQHKQRQFMIFRDLMRTRKVRLDADHVFALNLVDVEFYKSDKVLVAFRAYIEHLSSPLPMPSEKDRFFNRQADLMYTLLYEMGKELGYTFDKRDIESFSYGPIGWSHDQGLQRGNMGLLNELLRGTRSLPVSATPPRSNDLFPPPPTTSDR